MSHGTAPESEPLAVSPYDLLLAVLPLPLAFGVAGAWFLPVPTPVGVTVGGAASALLLGYGLFYRAPVGRERGWAAEPREPPGA